MKLKVLFMSLVATLTVSALYAQTYDWYREAPKIPHSATAVVTSYPECSETQDADIAALSSMPFVHNIVAAFGPKHDEVQNCAAASQLQIDDLTTAIADMMGNDGRPPMFPSRFCQDPPAGYADCMANVRADYDDAISDAVDAAVDKMEAALIKAIIDHAIGETFFNNGTERGRRKGCKIMSDAGAGASFAQWAAEEGFMTDSLAARMSYYSAADDCCFE